MASSPCSHVLKTCKSVAVAENFLLLTACEKTAVFQLLPVCSLSGLGRQISTWSDNLVLLVPRLQPCQSLRKQIKKSWWECAQKVNTTHFNWECKLIQPSSSKNRYGGFLKILENMPFLWLSYTTPEYSPQRFQGIAELLAQRYLVYQCSQLPNCEALYPTPEGWVRKWALYTQWHYFCKEEISHVAGRKMDATGGNHIK